MKSDNNAKKNKIHTYFVIWSLIVLFSSIKVSGIVIFTLILSLNIDIFDILNKDWEYRLDSYNTNENMVTLVSSYTPCVYRVSNLMGLTSDTVQSMVGSNIIFTYDKYNRIYSMEKKSVPILSYYDTYKPSTWDEVEKAANEFVNASNEYMNGVLNAIQKNEDEKIQKENARRKGAEELQKADDTSKNGAMLTFSSMPEEDRIYAYEAL